MSCPKAIQHYEATPKSRFRSGRTETWRFYSSKSILQESGSRRHVVGSSQTHQVYLASIFDTLLSSQGADAHHRRPLSLCWGNLSTLDHPHLTRQLGGSGQLCCSAGTVRLVFELVMLSSKAGILIGVLLVPHGLDPKPCGSDCCSTSGTGRILKTEAVRSSPVGRNKMEHYGYRFPRSNRLHLGRVAQAFEAPLGP